MLAGHYRLASNFVQRHPVHTVDQHSWDCDSNTTHTRNTANTSKRSSSLPNAMTASYFIQRDHSAR